MKIAYLFNSGRFDRLPDVVSGKSPSDFFYGAAELRGRGHEIGMFELIANSPVRFPYAICNIHLSQRYGPAYMDGGLLEQAKNLCANLNKYDCIVATTSGIAFCLALLRKAKYLSRPVVAVQCGLFNFPYNLMKTFFTSWLMGEVASVFFGNGEIQKARELLSSDKNRIDVCQFGVDLKFWSKGHPVKKDYVLCVGNDGRRDFDCLVNAAHLIPHEIKILTKRNINRKLPENVNLLNNNSGHRVITDIALRLLYQESKCVVIPLTDSFQPSGQSVALQAMACGTPVVITATSGFWNHEVFKDEMNLLFIRSGDQIDLAEKVNRIINSQELAEKITINALGCVKKFCSIEDFSQCIEFHCLDSCDSGSW